MCETETDQERQWEEYLQQLERDFHFILTRSGEMVDEVARSREIVDELDRLNGKNEEIIEKLENFCREKVPAIFEKTFTEMLEREVSLQVAALTRELQDARSSLRKLRSMTLWKFCLMVLGAILIGSFVGGVFVYCFLRGLI